MTYKFRMLSPKLALVWGFYLPYDAPFHSHWCPACNHLHEFAVDQPFHSNKARWTWDGDIIFPTFTPSMNIIIGPFPDGHKEVCHYFLRRGKIQFLGDCTHALKGQTVDLPVIPSSRFNAMARG